MNELEKPSQLLASLIDEERRHDYGDVERSAHVLSGIA